MTNEDPELSTLAWRTSSYSSGNGQCVEIAVCDRRTAVRDSKHPESVLWFGALNFATVARMRP
ncbi:MAG TPA: DUF397 domain-containing protein [Pseudonocardiaceae bacterium]|jgi:hypothetical protein|nr:DUF397 domain-containing protein [Pseudonocardiaceae bacterium]